VYRNEGRKEARQASRKLHNQAHVCRKEGRKEASKQAGKAHKQEKEMAEYAFPHITNLSLLFMKE
jgi:hypothetical protein